MYSAKEEMSLAAESTRGVDRFDVGISSAMEDAMLWWMDSRIEPSLPFWWLSSTGVCAGSGELSFCSFAFDFFLFVPF